MIIPYNKRYHRFYLGYGIVLLLLGLISEFSEPEPQFISAGFITGPLFIAIYFYRQLLPYGTIEEQKITKGFLFRKVIPIDENTRVAMYADQIEVHGADRKIVFEKTEIDKSALEAVEAYFRGWVLNR